MMNNNFDYFTIVGKIIIMSRKCEVTGKKPQSGNNRSKAMNATKRKWNVNLQPVTVVIDGKETKIMMSAKAIRTMKNKGKLV